MHQRLNRVAPSQHRLSLVGVRPTEPDAPTQPAEAALEKPSRASAVQQAAIRRHAAAGTSPAEAFALAARAALQGGRAAILTPERRQSLNRLAQDMGVRPFDATLIIAAVQDRARAGLPAPLAAELPLGPADAEPAKKKAKPKRKPLDPTAYLFMASGGLALALVGAVFLFAGS